MSLKTLFAIKIRVSRAVLFLLMIISPFIIILRLFIFENESNNVKIINDLSINVNKQDEIHKLMVDEFYQNRESWNTSQLGAVLFKNQGFPIVRPEKGNKTFVVFIYWVFHLQSSNGKIKYYGSYGERNSLQGCSVTNCVFSEDNRLLRTADAVVVNLHRGRWPRLTGRNPKQRWIFRTDESPKHTFSLSTRRVNYEELDNMFNWSMTYATDSDVPVPYGRMVPLAVPKYPFESLTLAKLIPNWKDKQRDVLVAILFSNCINYRMKLVADLQKHKIKVDAHGACGAKKFKNSCPGHFRADCKLLTKYLFYLALENSRCKEYMTEKLFYNAYYRGAIPIIQGPSLEDCKRLLPPHSYLHVDNYASIQDLADHIKKISEDENELFNYHWWRNHFEILNEHGYFGSKSFRLCRICEALNYNDDTEFVYSSKQLARFLDEKTLCH